MKIGILTHYDVNNLGAQLQMYATYQKLLELGHQPVILTYNKNFDFDYDQKLRNKIDLRSIPYLMREFLLKKGLRQTWHNTKKYIINKRFRLAHFDFQNYATSDVEAVIVGADEVFSLEVGINMMMYGHGMKTGKCIAYAPSFGQTDLSALEEHHARALVESGLSQFVALSARDEHTANMIFELTGHKPTMVCDPVLLYDFKNVPKCSKPIKQKYLAVYSYDRNMTDPEEIASICALAHRFGLITVSIGNYHKWCDKNINCDCLEWLDYMRCAEVIITDTFHGAVVSVIMGKESAVLVRDINSNKLNAFLQDMHLTERVISSLSEAELLRVFGKKTDYIRVEEVLRSLKTQSDRYLMEAIACCGEDNEKE